MDRFTTFENLQTVRAWRVSVYGQCSSAAEAKRFLAFIMPRFMNRRKVGPFCYDRV